MTGSVGQGHWVSRSRGQEGGRGEGGGGGEG